MPALCCAIINSSWSCSSHYSSKGVTLNRKGYLSKGQSKTVGPIEETLELIGKSGCHALNSSVDVGGFFVAEGKPMAHTSRAVPLVTAAIIRDFKKNEIHITGASVKSGSLM